MVVELPLSTSHCNYLNQAPLNNSSKLTAVKILHTLIWVFFNVVIFYMLFAAVKDRLDGWLWLCFGLVILEGLTLLLFKFYCPLTLIARRYTDAAGDNFDIYLPNWLARNTKLIYTTLVVIAFVLTVYRLLT